MKFLLSLLSGLLIATTVAAQDGDSKDKPNPYLKTPAPELRQRLANLAPIFEEKWYQVEVLVFARENPVTREYWRLDLTPEFVPNPIYLAGMPRPDSVPGDGPMATDGATDIDIPLLPEEAGDIERAAVENGAWRPLGGDALKKKVMAAMRDRMERQGDYRVLFHEAWRQPIREKGRAFSIHVEGGEKLEPLEISPLLGPLNPPADEVEEPLQPERDTAGDLMAPNADAVNATDSDNADDSFSEMRGELKLYLARYLHVEPNLWFTDESSAGDRFHVVIDQHRRMRSEELHYIDHPLFGLVLYIEPWETPEQEDATLMEEALEKQMERDDS